MRTAGEAERISREQEASRSATGCVLPDGLDGKPRPEAYSCNCPAGNIEATAIPESLFYRLLLFLMGCVNIAVKWASSPAIMSGGEVGCGEIEQLRSLTVAHTFIQCT